MIGQAPDREDIAAEVRDFQPQMIAGINRLTQDDAANGVGVDTQSIEVLPLPRDTGADNDAEQDARALELLTESGADVLVYGAIEANGATLVARPSLYLRALPRAEELAGRFSLERIGQDVSDPSGARVYRGRIAELGSELALVARLIEFYDGDDIDGGVDFFDSFDGTGALAGLLAVFEGNLRGKAGQFDDAAAAYERAAEDPSVAARAQLGLAQVNYSNALGPSGWCTDETDVDVMRDVIEQYEALKTAEAPSGANIEVKAQLGAGRARLCLETADLVTPSASGRVDLEAVIAAYGANRDDGDLRELAAEAEGVLGFVESTDATTEEALEQALVRLDRAIQLTVFTDRKVAFHLARAEAFAQINDGPTACRELDEVDQLLAGRSRIDELRSRYGC